jgi:hypothetical protein
MQRSFFGVVHKAIACTPNRNPDRDAYDRGVLTLARAIRQLEEELAGGTPDRAQAQQVLGWLSSIMEVKGVDPGEQQERLQEIRSEFGV